MEREKEVAGGGGEGTHCRPRVFQLKYIELKDEMHGMKFETARIHFLSEVFIAVALVVT